MSPNRCASSLQHERLARHEGQESLCRLAAARLDAQEAGWIPSQTATSGLAKLHILLSRQRRSRPSRALQNRERHRASPGRSLTKDVDLEPAVLRSRGHVRTPTRCCLQPIRHGDLPGNSNPPQCRRGRAELGRRHRHLLKAQARIRRATSPFKA